MTAVISSYRQLLSSGWLFGGTRGTSLCKVAQPHPADGHQRLGAALETPGALLQQRREQAGGAGGHHPTDRPRDKQEWPRRAVLREGSII